MSIRNLDAIFRPRAVALIGASRRTSSVGLVTVQNLLAGGFAGRIMPVNPKYAEVAGVTAYPDVAALPETPDLAVICTPARTVPGLIAELGTRGTKGAIVISAGFAELGTDAGRALQQSMLDAARPNLLRVIGPNCVGVISTPTGINASFATANARKGSIAFVTQSGAIVTSVLEWANARGIGFSHLVSLGDMADVDFGDMLDYLANDPGTSAILLYIEAITHPRKFLSAARAAARLKPVIAIKAGRHEAAARAAASHTGALAGMDAVYDAAFRRAGILRVYDLEEVFDAVETLAATPSFPRDDLIVLTNGGGVGVLAVDGLLDQGGQLTPLSPETVAKLDSVLPATWSRSNPVDIVGDASAARYADALKVLLEAPEANAILVLNCPTAVASSIEAAQAVIEVSKVRSRPVLTNWLGGKTAAAARQLFTAARVPTYDTPGGAVRGFMHLVRHRKAQEILLEVPPSVAAEFAPDEKAARRIIAAAAKGETWLAPDKVQEILDCYRIPVARSGLATTANEAVDLARAFGGLVAVKLVSPDIVHKSDVGGVILDVQGDDAVRSAVESIRTRVARALPEARIGGFLIQQMIRRAGAYELIAGMSVDRQFGPFILFGQGGTAVEIISDRAIALPPLNLALARELVGQTRISHQLRGFRDHPPVALEALALTLVKLSQLVCDLDEVVEIDLNPLLVDTQSVIALDARIRIGPAVEPAARGKRLPIRPYPKELESTHALTSIGDVLLRPIKPEDAAALAAFVADLAPEDARLRFFVPLRTLEGHSLARLAQIDYDREMAFLLEKEAASGRRLLGVARLAADPDNRRAEFAIVVRSDLHRRGLGRFLLQRLIDYARQRGIAELEGDVLPNNVAMLSLCRELGFVTPPSDAGGMVRVVRLLNAV